MILGLIQLFIDSLAGLLSMVISVLPKSPFKFVSDYVLSNDILGAINYFLPVSQMVSILEGWLAAIGIYYCYMVFARWAKILD